ncbi:MAG: DNA polymerase III subunit alpha [Hallerella porci]|uniref:DNA polymerase III subunit alpha n=1 Tax=Hallerella porci TaxID=1945871 RepID=A0ABX5LN68_9BACT|nr:MULTISPECIES: DNA polymerase III subunit alpha [Hallerella]MCI5601026.1 DNA polymerase III subunit alpha [Hallerella sp.]MDY3920741.1 DNA polymerase III subunit alpha [Hallerella porci]PWL03851.1 DNA polymerase-3 subunit alpha [Hallerella porci]
MSFVHLQVHSEFSILKSSARLDDIFSAAEADNAPAIALTDHGAMFGILEFQTRGKALNKKRKEKGLPPIKTIYGCHIYVDTSGANFKDPSTYERLTLLVENEKGYYNLLRIVSYRYEESKRWEEIPSVPLEIIEAHKEGIIAIAGDFFSRYGINVSAGREAPAKAFMESLTKIFDREHLYFSLCDNGIAAQKTLNLFTTALAKEFDRELVAVGDVHYIRREDAAAHKALRCIALVEKFKEFADKRFPTDQFYYRTEAEMRELFPDHPEAIENSNKIAERCFFEVKTGIGDDFWPRYAIPKEFLESEECKEIYRVMEDEYNKGYPLAFANAAKDYCAKNEGKTVETFTAEDKAAVEKIMEKTKTSRHGGDADAYLIYLTNQRLKRRYPDEEFQYPNHGTEVSDRVYKELNCIRNMNVAGYLLIVWDFINWSREHGIPVGPGRGSAAGSIVTYIIGITNIDPLKFGLLFERFLNPERVSMPDIDTDISDRDRGRVIDYVTQKYGSDCVGQIITYGMLKSKAVIKDVARVLGIDHREADAIIRNFPQRVLNFSLNDAWTGKDKKGKPVSDDYNPEPLHAFVNSREAYKELWDIALKLEDLPRQTGVHACGVVITPTPIYNLAPLYRADPADTPVVMYDKHYAEDIGLLKMDFLGLINLSIIQDTVNMVKKTHQIDVDMDKIPTDDKATFELLSRGMTTAVFQFESPGMQKYLRELKPSRISDLIAMNALYRPGPIDQIPHFINRKLGKEKIDCYHPDLEPVLGETYGVIVYQEQVMQLAQILGGYTLGGADNIRRIMAKKMPEKMAKLEPEFKKKCTDKGYDPAMIQKVWDAVLPFCGYAFNKSHAAAYAYVAYQTAYLKTHYGPEYMAASMTSKMGKTEDIVTIVQECKRMGITVLPPDINSSLGVFSANAKGQVVYGLAGIRNVGLPVIEDVVAERELHGPYKTLFDVCKRVSDYQSKQPEKRPPLSRKAIESLVLAGAFDKMSPTTPNRPTLMASVEKAIEVANRHRRDQDAGQTSLFDMFGGDSTESQMDESYEEAQPWGLMELLNKERDVLGLYLSAHPLDECRPELRGFTTNSLAESELNEIVDRNPKSIVCVGGIITKLRSFQSKKDETKTMGSGTLQDFQGEISIFFPPDTWERCRDHFGEDDRVIVRGKLTPQNLDPSSLQIIVDRAFSMDEVRNKLVSFIHVSVSSMELVDERMTAILERMEMAQALPGEHAAEVVFHVETLSGHIHTLRAQVIKVAYTPDFFEWLQREFGAENVWVSAKVK